MSKIDLKEIAKEIVELEKSVSDTKDVDAEVKVGARIMQLIEKHKLNLDDIIAIDEIAQSMLK